MPETESLVRTGETKDCVSYTYTARDLEEYRSGDSACIYQRSSGSFSKILRGLPYSGSISSPLAVESFGPRTLQLRSQVRAHGTDAEPTFKFGPRVYTSADSDIEGEDRFSVYNSSLFRHCTWRSHLNEVRVKPFCVWLHEKIRGA